MRAVVIILAGLVCWVPCLAIGKVFAASPGALTAATALFVRVWILVAAIKMWGVYRAGYS